MEYQDQIVYEDGSIEGVETQPMDQMQWVENTPVDRCVHIAEDAYYCVTPETTDTMVNSLAPVLGFWSQYMQSGFTSNGWSQYFLDDKYRGIFEWTAWVLNMMG